MTQQFPEVLRFWNLEYYTDQHPLGSCLLDNEIATQLENTALRRGYQGQWEVRERKLVLTELRGLLADGQPLSVESVFRGSPTQVADWFSGDLRAERGASTPNVDAGLPASWEYELCLRVANGEVRRSVQLRNSVSATPEVLDLQIQTTDKCGSVVGSLTFTDLMRLADLLPGVGGPRLPDGSTIGRGGTFESFPGPTSITFWHCPPAEGGFGDSYKYKAPIWKVTCEFVVASEDEFDRLVTRKVYKAGSWETQKVPHKLDWISVTAEVAEDRIAADLATVIAMLGAAPR